MNRNRHLAIATAITALLAFTGVGARAQQPGFRGRFGPPFGGLFGTMGPVNGVDPMRSAMLQLLQRDDVDYELNIDLNQKSAIANENTASAQEMGSKMRDAFQTFRQNRGNFRSMTPEERQYQRTQMQQQMQQAVDQVQVDTEGKLAAILTPAQMKRLKELDLQWRGPLALADPRIADPMNLNQPEHTGIAAALQAYRDAQRTAVRSLFAGVRFPPRLRQPGGGLPLPQSGVQAAPPNPPNPPSPEELASRRDAAQKAVQAALKQQGDKVLALLTPAHRQQWLQMTGKPFHFREMDNTQSQAPVKQ
ncbi:MAG TPA: hypothetical protein VGS41_15530 [Chthonomonadales bacterium]|nr:hypothetical protein [Chthonomonadales bacterium]